MICSGFRSAHATYFTKRQRETASIYVVQPAIQNYAAGVNGFYYVSGKGHGEAAICTDSKAVFACEFKETEQLA